MLKERRIFNQEGNPLHKTERGKFGNIFRCKECGIVFCAVYFGENLEFIVLKEGRLGVHTNDYYSKFLLSFNGTKYPLLGSRKDTFLRFFVLCFERQARTIVETGTIKYVDWERWGCSTILFGEYCQYSQGHLWTIDPDSFTIKKSMEITQKYAPFITYCQEDPVIAVGMGHPPDSIDALYLDGPDYAGGDMTLRAIQERHLAEIKSAYPKLHDKSIVMIDDCKHSDGTRGKGELVIPWLEEQGWEIDTADYQVIMVKKRS